MNHALWLLIGLRCKSWLRRLGRMLRTVKGVVLAIALAVCFLPMLISVAVTLVVHPEGSHRLVDPDALRRYGTAGLLAYCLMTLLFVSPGQVLHFTPPEVDFLFTGPFSRRQLLLYKMVMALLSVMSTAAFMSIFTLAYAHSFAAAFTGLFLALFFLQLFTMATGLVAGTVGVLAYSRARKLLLALVAAAAVVAVVRSGNSLTPSSAKELAEWLERSPMLSTLVMPLRCFVEVFVAERLWPDLVLWAALSLIVDGVLVGLVLVLDYQYLESAAIASERLYARLQRLRKGGWSAQWGSTGRVRSSLPSLPWWSGLGPNCWRQLLAARRSLKGVVFFVAIFGASMLGPMLIRGHDAARPALAGGSLAGTLLVMSLFILPMMLTFDFRGDIDRMDLLKSLPLSPAPLVLGQLLTPVILASAIELAILALVQGFVGGVGALFPLAVAFAVPVNFLLFGLENLLFLLYPTRVAAATPGDVQAMGRQMVFFWVKFLCLGLIVGVIALAAALVALVTDGGWPAALPTAWLLLVAVDGALVPPLCAAFRKFDVAHDTPP